MPETKEVFVVPLKSFDVAKERLRRGGIDDVTNLARDLATGVIRNCAPRQVVVLSESGDVTTFAQELDTEVLESSASNLNEAVQGAYARLSDRCERIIVVHGDLREPEGLGEYQPGAGVTIVTDYLSRGTNVLVVPTGLDFHFQYGDDSARLHQLEAERLGVAWRLITDSPWRFDVDEPSDMQRP
jgi:2-phospho-L-lactate guanylyltransferase (CobY/MobA/RfbA family)